MNIHAWREAVDMNLVYTGFLVAGAVWIGKQYWKRQAHKVKQEERLIVSLEGPLGYEELAGERQAQEQGQPTMYDLDKTAQQWADFLDLDLDELDHFENCLGEKVKLVSFGRFLRHLKLSGHVDLRTVAVTFVSFIGMDILLPMLGKVPKVSRKDTIDLDPFWVKVAQIVMTNLLSPVTISAISITMHKSAQALVLDTYDPVAMLARGISGSTRPCLETLPNPFRFPEDYDEVMARLIEAEKNQPEPGEADPTPISKDFLPGLLRGAPGLMYRETVKQRARSRLMTVIFNKLTNNNLLYREEDPVLFKVQVRFPDEDEDQTFTQLAKFVTAIGNHKDHKLEVGIRTLLTSFGNCFVANDNDGTTFHIPMAVPMRTGITSLPSKQEIVVPMSHAGVPVVMEGPLFGGQVGVEWYQNIGSFTGWHPYIWRKWPWHLGAERWHQEFYKKDWTLEKQIELVMCASALACLVNVSSRDRGFVEGGYGYTGVCLDSVAILQNAVMGETTIFPLLLSGQARTDLLDVSSTLRPDLDEERGRIFDKVVQSIIHLETDIDIPPRQAVQALHRLDKTLPERSIFKLVKQSRHLAHQTQEYLNAKYLNQ